jgi:septal ring factor EnvC (AmiA/AmiB activator)
MRVGGLVGAALVVILAGGLVVGVAGAEEESRRLRELREEIEAREARAHDLRDEAEGVLGELEAVDRELHEVRRSVRLLRQRRREAETDLKETRARVSEAAKKRERLQMYLEKRLVALYKFYATGGVPAFYSAGTFQEILQRREALGRVLRQDEALFARYRAAETEWVANRDRAKALLSEIKRTQSHETVREDRVRKQLVERKNLVALLQTRADRERRAAAELREAAKRLESFLKKRRRQSSPGGGLVKGTLAPPVQGSVRLGFGSQVDPEFGTETLRNGIEIESPAGAPVRAVAGGQVLFAGWFRGYGQIVILDHGGDDTTVSGYLEERAVQAGAAVKRGDVIGKVGETGSFSGPGLYFEIRRDGTPVNPEGWFRPPGVKGRQ